MTIISSRFLLYVRALTNSVAALMADVLNRGAVESIISEAKAPPSSDDFTKYYGTLCLRRRVTFYLLLAPFQEECDALERETTLSGSRPSLFLTTLVFSTLLATVIAS